MTMSRTINVLNSMVRDGIITKYAISGAVAALYYVEVSSTDDLDILVSFDDADAHSKTGLIMLTPIVTYLAHRGYDEFRKEGIVIEGWPVQFLPVASDLDAEALDHAEEVELRMPSEDVPVTTHLLKPEYLLANAIAVNRPKDRLRIMQFLDEGVFDQKALSDVLNRHRLAARWVAFCQQAGIDDPCDVRLRP